jgi:hypothetical protein
VFNIVFRCATFPFAWIGGRSHTEVFGPAPAATPSAALTGAALLLASVLSAAGWHLWLTGTPVVVLANPLALCLAVLQALFFRQMLRNREVALGAWQGPVCLALAAGALVPGAWLASLQIPAHAVVVTEARTYLSAQKQQIDGKLLRLQDAVATHQLEVNRLAFQVQQRQAAIAVSTDASERCSREVETLRPLLPDSTASDEDRALVQNYARLAALCEKQQASASALAARMPPRHALQLQETETRLQAAQTALTAAQQAVPGPAFIAAQQTLQAAQAPCAAWPSCGLQLAAATGQLAYWELWGSTLLLFVVVMLPVGLTGVLAADVPARQRRQVAAEDRVLDMAWQGGLLEAAAARH